MDHFTTAILPNQTSIGSIVKKGQDARKGVTDMTQARHPLAEKLHKLRNQKLTTEELVATLEMAQLEVEELWDSQPAVEGPTCGHLVDWR
jgi:hypothetical protein